MLGIPGSQDVLPVMNSTEFLAFGWEFLIA